MELRNSAGASEGIIARADFEGEADGGGEEEEAGVREGSSEFRVQNGSLAMGN